MIGKMRLLADQRDGVFIALGAERERDLEASLASADDHNSISHILLAEIYF